MDHLQYIAAAYGLGLVVIGWLALDAVRRTARARRQLAAIDVRGERAS